MRDVLIDVVKQLNIFPEAKITGSPDKTFIQAFNKEKTIFLEAVTKEPIQEFTGAFGLSNMGLLNGFLNFPNFRSDDATFNVATRERDGESYVERFEFRNPVTRNSSDFWLMHPSLVAEPPLIRSIPWEISVVPSKAKVAEFSQIANLLAASAQEFGIRVTKKDGDLEFFIGNNGTHNSSMVFEAGVKGDRKDSSPNFSINEFLSLIKLSGSHPTTIKIAQAVIGIVVETEFGTYSYFLRAVKN